MKANTPEELHKMLKERERMERELREGECRHQDSETLAKMALAMQEMMKRYESSSPVGSPSIAVSDATPVDESDPRCPKCGSVVRPKQLFCTRCGTKLGTNIL